MISGLTPNNRTEPVRPTAVERTSPGLLRSMSHQSKGFTSANVAATWKVEAHANLRC